MAGRYEEALSWCRKGMLERPDLVWPLRLVAACLGHLGRIAEAREVVRQLPSGRTRHNDIEGNGNYSFP